jgi:hypothetical protein
MGIQDVRNAFLQAGQNKLRITDCELHTVQDGNNSQQLIINGFDMNGKTFELDSKPFDAKVSPVEKAKEMARGVLSQPAGFRLPPQAAEHP